MKISQGTEEDRTGRRSDGCPTLTNLSQKSRSCWFRGKRRAGSELQSCRAADQVPPSKWTDGWRSHVFSLSKVPRKAGSLVGGGLCLSPERPTDSDSRVSVWEEGGGPELLFQATPRPAAPVLAAPAHSGATLVLCARRHGAPGPNPPPHSRVLWCRAPAPLRFPPGDQSGASIGPRGRAALPLPLKQTSLPSLLERFT